MFPNSASQDNSNKNDKLQDTRVVGILKIGTKPICPHPPRYLSYEQMHWKKWNDIHIVDIGAGKHFSSRDLEKSLV